MWDDFSGQKAIHEKAPNAFPKIKIVYGKIVKCNQSTISAKFLKQNESTYL